MLHFTVARQLLLRDLLLIQDGGRPMRPVWKHGDLGLTVHCRIGFMISFFQLDIILTPMTEYSAQIRLVWLSWAKTHIAILTVSSSYLFGRLTVSPRIINSK